MFASCPTGIVCQRAAEGKSLTIGNSGFDGSRGKLTKLMGHIDESGCHWITVFGEPVLFDCRTTLRL